MGDRQGQHRRLAAGDPQRREARQIRADAERELHAEQRKERRRHRGRHRIAASPYARGDHRHDHEDGDRSDEVEIDDTRVSQERPEHDLRIGDGGGGDRERPRGRCDRRQRRARVGRGQQDDHREQGEEDLGQAAVDDGEHVLEQHDAQPAQKPLHRHGHGRDETQRAQAAAPSPERSGERQREQTDHRADQAMAVLVEDAAHHL